MRSPGSLPLGLCLLLAWESGLFGEKRPRSPGQTVCTLLTNLEPELLGCDLERRSFREEEV